MDKHIIVYSDQIVETEDCKRWMYDTKHHEWIDVSTIKGNFVKIK